MLIANDDLRDRLSFGETMRKFGTMISYAASTAEVLDLFTRTDFCLVIMDVHPTNKNDLETLYMMRKSKTMPILALTPPISPSDKIKLFQSGANVCLEKPADLEVCAAQANSLIQLYLEAQEENRADHPLIFGTELIINPMYRHVIIDGEQLTLTKTEFDLLFCLAKHPGRVWSRSQLYQHIWSDDTDLGGENTVRAHIGNLRKKLADVGKDYIQTSWGVGYKFMPPA